MASKLVRVTDAEKALALWKAGMLLNELGVPWWPLAGYTDSAYLIGGLPRWLDGGGGYVYVETDEGC